MKSLIFTIKTITPTFMGGGDGRFDGIRTSEIKGMMRWWFRALAGGLIGDNLTELKRLEGSIFGATESDRAGRSKFKLVIEKTGLQFIKNSSQIPSNGYTYLGIGNVIFKYDNSSRQFKPNIDKSDPHDNTLLDAKSTFKLRFLFYPQANIDDINLIAGSFYLATALGGFGLRSRKCFGSWQIVDYEGMDLKFNPKDYTKRGIEENIKTLKSILQTKTNNHTPASLYPAIDNTKFVFSVVETAKTEYEELLDKFGQLYRGFRVCAEKPSKDLPRKGIHTSDFDFLIKATATKNCPSANLKDYKIRNALFGLNIVYPRYGTLQVERVSEILRRASPVWFSVKEVDGKLNLHIVLFKSLFKPIDSKVRFKGINVEIEEKPFYLTCSKKIGFKGIDVEIEDYELIEKNFIPYIEKELGGEK